jgi:hypothetical protein
MPGISELRGWVMYAHRGRHSKKYRALAPVMNEKVKRLWLASEAAAIGKGGVAIVTKATGVEHKRINAAARDLKELSPPAKEQPRSIRRPGGGRKSLVAKDCFRISYSYTSHRRRAHT